MKTLNNYINEAWSGVKQLASIDVEAIEAWCKEMRIKNYIIDPTTGVIDVDYFTVNLSKKNFKELPYKFGKVRGNFDLSECKNLISLKNCPDRVNERFSCDKCPKLKSLEGCPSYVGGWFICDRCDNLESLEGCPKELFYEFSCSNCPKLKSLEGGPSFVGGNFKCYYCSQLDSLKYCPKRVMGNFECYDCKGEFTKKEIKTLCVVDKKIVV